MAIHNVTGQMLTRPKQRTAQTTRIPSPAHGIDTRAILSQGDPNYCLYSYNLLPSSYGMSLRSGYREWCIDLDNGAGEGVRTIIPFDAPVGQVNDRLFAITNEGIWDATEYNNPSLVYTFPITTGAAGYGVYTHYVNQAAIDLVFYADQENGLIQYDHSTGLWEQPTGINNVDVTKVQFVMNHKQRLWLIEKESTSAWYLPIASQAGDATEFYFGSKFSHGGNLVGLYNWSLDGGDGIDDYLTAVSKAGDVLPYRGSDPSSSDDWENVGVYYIGDVPVGSRLSSEHGGNLYLLSAFGLTSMSELTTGIDTSSPSKDSVTYRISNAIRAEIKKSMNEYGWGVVLLPSIAGMLVSSPQQSNGVWLQYYYSVDNEGWGYFRGVPMLCIDEFQGFPYIGSPDNKVYISDGYIDDEKITPPPAGEQNGKDIEFSILSSFTDLGEPALYKKIKYIRPDFLGTQKPQEVTRAVFDYRLEEIQGGSFIPVGVTGVWDTAVWGKNVWGGYQFGATSRLVGNYGSGRMVAVATRGQSKESMVLLDWDLIYETGGAV